MCSLTALQDGKTAAFEAVIQGKNNSLLTLIAADADVNVADTVIVAEIFYFVFNS